MTPASESNSPDRPAGKDKKILFLDWTLISICFGISLGLSLAFARGAPGLPVDDAYIHSRFASNLGEGLGFCFNPGEFSLGFSSPLWVALLGVLSAIGVDPVEAARIGGEIFLAVSAALVYKIAARSVAMKMAKAKAVINVWPLVMGALAGLGVALSGNMLWLAGSGMESAMFLCLGAASILLFSRGRYLIAPGIFLGLMILVRPTGGGLLIVLAAILFLAGERSWKAWMGLGLSIIIAAPWYLYSFARTGYLLPPTRAGKLASDIFNSGPSPQAILRFAEQHVIYLWTDERGVILLGLVGVVAALAALFASKVKNKDGEAGESALMNRLTRVTPAGVFMTWALFHFLLHALFFRSASAVTPYHYLRYQIALIPAIWAFSVTAMAWAGVSITSGLAQRAKEKPSARGGLSPANFALTTAALIIIGALAMELLFLGAWRQKYFRNADQLKKEHRAAAEWARVFTGEGESIACLDIGCLGYYSRRRIIDLGGLTDPTIIPYLDKRRTGPYLLAKKTDYYFEMTRHGSEWLTGVMADNGKLYNLSLVNQFDYPPPFTIHSLTIKAYKIREIQ